MTKVLAALVCAGLLCAQQAPIEEAWNWLAKGDRGQAVRVLQRILQANPRNGDARLMLGSILSEDGKQAEAIGQLQQAVRLLPGSAEAHNALGEALKSSGDGKAAQAEFETAVALDGKFAQAHVNLGLALLESGERARAAQQLDRAIQLLGRTPDAAYPKYLRAKIYTGQEQVEKAAAELNDAVSLRPDFAEAWSDLGQARVILRDEAGALAAFQRSVEADPENAVSQYRLGSAYLRQGDARRAVRHLQEAFRLQPGDQSTLYSLQLALRQNGQLEEARRVKEKLSELLRNIDNVSRNEFAALRLNNEGAALEKAGNLKAALEKYRAALERDPAHIGIRVNFAVALLRLGRWGEGIAELREALRRDPKNAVVQAALDDALAQAPKP